MGNFIQNKIDNAKKDMKFLQKVKRIMNKKSTQDSIRQLIKNSMKEFNKFEEIEIKVLSVNSNYNEISIETIDVPYYTDYDNICSKATNITYNNSIEYNYKEQIEIEGITFYVECYQSAKIPDEEMILLKHLGKVEERFIESKVETSIFCTN